MEEDLLIINVQGLSNFNRILICIILLKLPLTIIIHLLEFERSIQRSEEQYSLDFDCDTESVGKPIKNYDFLILQIIDIKQRLDNENKVNTSTNYKN